MPLVMQNLDDCLLVRACVFVRVCENCVVTVKNAEKHKRCALKVWLEHFLEHSSPFLFFFNGYACLWWCCCSCYPVHCSQACSADECIVVVGGEWPAFFCVIVRQASLLLSCVRVHRILALLVRTVLHHRCNAPLQRGCCSTVQTDGRDLRRVSLSEARCARACYIY